MSPSPFVCLCRSQLCLLVSLILTFDLRDCPPCSPSGDGAVAFEPHALLGHQGTVGTQGWGLLGSCSAVCAQGRQRDLSSCLCAHSPPCPRLCGGVFSQGCSPGLEPRRRAPSGCSLLVPSSTAELRAQSLSQAGLCGCRVDLRAKDREVRGPEAPRAAPCPAPVAL